MQQRTVKTFVSTVCFIALFKYFIIWSQTLWLFLIVASESCKNSIIIIAKDGGKCSSQMFLYMISWASPAKSISQTLHWKNIYIVVLLNSQGHRIWDWITVFRFARHRDKIRVTWKVDKLWNSLRYKRPQI